jgi:class 3 adenylate cyclase
MDRSPVEYAKSGGVHVAYQVVGHGPLDIVFVPGHISNLEFDWDIAWAPIRRRLARFARVIAFDKRGTGLSDRLSESALPNLEERMDDIRCVMDAARSPKATLIGISEGSAMSMLFASTYPERTNSLILYGAFARLAWADEIPWGIKPNEQEVFLATLESTWGRGAGVPILSPSVAGDTDYVERYARFERASASPSAAVALLRMDFAIDIRDILPAIRVPTLILHAKGDRAVSVEHGRYVAERIPRSALIELDLPDHDPVTEGHASEIVDHIERFLTGVKREPEPDRVLATILFTDIVGSTSMVTQLGDRRWQELLERHHALVRAQLSRFRGRELDVAGDGFFASFDGPARAIRCALAIREALSAIGLRVRIGLHCGECQRTGSSLTGLNVHLAARISSTASAGEVRVSNTIRELVAGSEIEFEECGQHELAGLPGDWSLWRVVRE